MNASSDEERFERRLKKIEMTQSEDSCNVIYAPESCVLYGRKLSKASQLVASILLSIDGDDV